MGSYISSIKIRILVFVFLLFIFVSCTKAKDNVNQKRIKVNPHTAQRFYDITKIGVDKVNVSILTEQPEPDRYKVYTDAKKIKLSLPNFKGLSLEEIILKRRSKRQSESFSGEAVSLDELSQLLFSASGITGRNKALELRAAPSAGATYPIEIYLVVNDVSGLARGIYHYAVKEYALELICEGDFRDKIEHAVMGQSGVRDSGVVFVFSAIPGRTTKKYDLRGWRYVYMEVGYISENLYLEATSLGLSTTAMGAFYDDELNQLLGLDGREEMALHVQVFGGKDAVR
ncbi:MAG TPA: SagB/ThcOx family dehydrogenase [Candidatus Omnitrophica bacterium]|nr:SagB/ThcOx family dehydrogenase [Candidatus Omnitrophota bacterium]